MNDGIHELNKSEDIELKEKHLLLVEDKDIEHFFKALAGKLDLKEFQIINFEGKDNLFNRLEMVKINTNFPNIISLGIARDAEKDPEPLKSVASALKRLGLPAPKRALTPTGKNPVVTIMILPNEGKEGNIEDLCLESIKDDPAMECVDKYIECLKKLPPKKKFKNESKARLHAFLSSREIPGKPIGLAITFSYLPFRSTAFDDAKKFLKQVALQKS